MKVKIRVDKSLLIKIKALSDANIVKHADLSQAVNSWSFWSHIQLSFINISTAITGGR
jgi:hypothetical protein